MGDRRKGKGKASRGNGSNTKDYTSDATAQSSSSHVDRGIKNPVEYLDYCQMNEKLEAAAFNRGSKSDKFVPLNRLEDIWRDRLGRFLVILGLGKDIFLVNDITKNLIKTLSILVTIGWKKWDAFGDIFLEERGGSVRGDRNDHNLPYPLAILEGQDGDPFLGEHWAGKFRAEQSTFIPIIIKEGGNEIYREGRPLPFIRSQTLKLKNGGYGSVTREIIACHHFQSRTPSGEPFLHPKEMRVARKRFPARGDFKKEARNLADLNSSLSDHKRIVRYLAVFTVEDEEDQDAQKEFNIILPLADTDLQQFLYDKAFEGSWGNVAEIVKEASNLADAMRWLHEGQIISGKVLVCCHMDIKLDNVLVYQNDNPPVGWWKISDFGISSLKERKKERIAPQRPTSALLTVPTTSPAESLRIITAQMRTTVKRPAGAFSAPEVEAGGNVGPESDIFSFGCILFQVLARATGGIRLLKELDDNRASFEENGTRNDHFCQRMEGRKAIHKDVSLWLKTSDGLRGTLPDRSMTMNCKKLIEKTLEIPPEARPSAATLHAELAKIAHGEGEEYSFDKHSNLLSDVSRSSASKPKSVDRPQICIKPSPPKTEQEDLPDRMSVLTMKMPTSPPISPRPTRGTLEINAQPFQPISQPLPTPPLDTDHQDSPETVQPGPMPPMVMGRAPPRNRPDNPPPPPPPNFSNTRPQNTIDFQRTSDQPPLPHFYNPAVQNTAYFQRTSDQPPPRHFYNPTARNTVDFQRTSDQPPPHFYNNPAQNTADYQYTSPLMPLPQSPMTFPGQRSRKDSAHTSQSFVHDVVARRSERGELIPFTTPPGVISTIISSTRAKIIFIAPKEAVVYTLYGPDSDAYSKTISPPQNCKWQNGSLAGDFVALCSVSDSHNTQGLHLYKLSLSYHNLMVHEIQLKTELPYFEKFTVSMDGRLLLGRSNTVRLYESCDAEGKELQIPASGGSKLQRVWFSTNGLLAFAWFSLPGNLHNVKIWDVVDTNINGVLPCQIPESDNSASAVKDIVHFPSSPMCMVWKEHDFVSLLQNSERPQSAQAAHSQQLKNLQAIVVTPNEEAIIFIRSSRKGPFKVQFKSTISIARIHRIGETRVLGSISEEKDLLYYLKKPAKCDVVIDRHTSTNTMVRVWIAHSNGDFEVKDVDLP